MADGLMDETATDQAVTQTSRCTSRCTLLQGMVLVPAPAPSGTTTFKAVRQSLTQG